MRLSLRVSRVSRWLAPLALAIIFVSPARAQEPPPNQPPVEHFKIYRIQTPVITGIVSLIDQFTTHSTFLPFEGPFFLGTPAMKNDEPVLDYNTHQTWYRYFEPQPERLVAYSNQFGDDYLRTFDALWMLVPAIKNQPRGAPLPQTLSHFKCYNAVGQPVLKTVTLYTQFGFEQVVVEAPELFCNPAVKILPDGVQYPIVNDTDHLVCYRISPQIPIGTTVTLEDQFGFREAYVLENNYLCVPSKKNGVVGTDQSTWGRVKALYR